MQRWEDAIPGLQDRPEAWYHLGDQLFHFGAELGIQNFLGRAKDAFARAVALDSTYFTPLHHLVLIAEIEGDTAFVHRTVERYLETEQTGTVVEEFRLRLAAALAFAARPGRSSSSSRVMGSGTCTTSRGTSFVYTRDEDDGYVFVLRPWAEARPGTR